MRKTIKEIVEAYKTNQYNISKTARNLGISRSTVRRWIVRGRSIYSWKGNIRWRGVSRKSTKPHKIHRSIDDKQERIIIKVRKETGYDKRKLAFELKLKHGINVSSSTVYRIIKKRSPNLFRNVLQYKRPKFQNGKAMRPVNTKNIGYLQMDVKYVTPELSGLPYTCYEYALIDILSRYKMALILPILDESGSILALKYVIENAPFKILYVQTDNGLEYQAQFDMVCRKLGIKHYYIHKNSPNENAVVERSFRTDQEEFFFRLQKQPEDINELNKCFQKFLTFYNEERPHFGLEFKTPLEVVRGVSKVVDH
jgi:transposase InsO family protein